MKMRIYSLRLIICIPFLWAANAMALTTITMDEVPYQKIDGLSVKGVYFEFAIKGMASDEAAINSFGAGDLNYISGSSLEGTTEGELSIFLETPTPDFSFGIALMSEDALSRAASVSVYKNNSALPQQYWIDTQPLVIFSEAQFHYSGDGASIVKINFYNPRSRFAFDNLTFNVTPSIPEPTMFSLLCAGGLVLGLASIKSKNKNR